MAIKTITVTTSAQLSAALKAATGGETIVLSGSAKFSLIEADINPASNVTITSANPDAMATLSTLSLTRSSNVTIDSVQFNAAGVTRADYLSDVNFTTCKNVALINSVLTGTATAYNDGTAVVGDTAINISGSTGVIVAGNVIQNYFRGLLGSGSSNVIIEGNEMTKIQGDGMQFTTMNTLLIKDNYLHDFLGSAHSLNHDDMIQFWTANSTVPSKNITITGNILDSGDGASTQGIFFGNDVAKANPSNTAMYYQNISITNNFVRNSEFNGITVYYVNGLSVKDNAVLFDATVTNKTSTANVILIQVAGAATNAVVSNNVVDQLALLSSVSQGNNTRPARGSDGSSVVLSSYYPDKTDPVVDLDTPVASPTAPVTQTPTTGGSANQGTANADTLNGTANADTISGGGGDDKIFGNGGADVLYGDDGNDTINGGDGDDGIRGGIGNDTVYGGAGNDTIYGETGDDLLYGDDGNDTIHGGDGADGIRAGNGADVVHAGAGNDTVYGDAGNDFLYGEDGNDTIHAGDGDDAIRAGTGADTVNAGTGNDAAYGDAGNDVLRGEAGNDTLSGGDGDDKLSGGTGRDSLTGGAGYDQFVFDAARDGNIDTIVDFNTSQDKIALETDVYSAFAGKTLSAANLRVGSMAQDSNDFLLYVNGVLYYDPDGNGSQQAQAMAQLSNKASLSISNFLLI